MPHRPDFLKPILPKGGLTRLVGALQPECFQSDPRRCFQHQADPAVPLTPRPAAAGFSLRRMARRVARLPPRPSMVTGSHVTAIAAGPAHERAVPEHQLQQELSRHLPVAGLLLLKASVSEHIDDPGELAMLKSRQSVLNDAIDQLHSGRDNVVEDLLASQGAKLGTQLAVRKIATLLEHASSDPASTLGSCWPRACRRRSNFDPPCRANIDPGMEAGNMLADCGQV